MLRRSMTAQNSGKSKYMISQSHAIQGSEFLQQGAPILNQKQSKFTNMPWTITAEIPMMDSQF